MSSNQKTTLGPKGAAASKAAAAWAGDPPQRSAAQERLLDAAARCIARDGLTSTGIAAVAAEAGVSRPTVYRYFADRRELIQATLIRAAAMLNVRIDSHLQRFSSPAEKAVQAVLFAIVEVPRESVLREVWTSAALDAAALEGFTGPSSIAFSRKGIRDLEVAAGWSAAEADEAMEVMLRFILSLLAAPEPRRNARELRAFLERRLVPALGLSER